MKRNLMIRAGLVEMKGRGACEAGGRTLLGRGEVRLLPSIIAPCAGRPCAGSTHRKGTAAPCHLLPSDAFNRGLWTLHC